MIQLCGFHSVNMDTTDKLGNGSVIVVMRTLCVPGSWCVMVSLLGSGEEMERGKCKQSANIFT